MFDGAQLAGNVFGGLPSVGGAKPVCPHPKIPGPNLMGGFEESGGSA